MRDSEFLTNKVYQCFVTYNERWQRYQEAKDKNGGKSPERSPKREEGKEGGKKRRHPEDMMGMDYDDEYGDEEEMMMMRRHMGPRGMRGMDPRMMREFGGPRGMYGMGGGRSRGPTMPEGIHGKQLPCKLNMVADGKMFKEDTGRRSSMMKWDVPYVKE